MGLSLCLCEGRPVWAQAPAFVWVLERGASQVVKQVGLDFASKFQQAALLKHLRQTLHH